MTKDPKGTWSDGGKVWEGRPAVGGDYQHGYADGIEWATVHGAAPQASPLRGREPTEAMVLAASEHKGQMSYADVWRVMFDAADSPPEQPAADNVKTLLETIDAKNARIGELEEALGKATGRDEVIYECAMAALEQRCQRGTPWDLACTTIAEKIRALSAPSKELPAARPMGQS